MVVVVVVTYMLQIFHVILLEYIICIVYALFNNFNLLNLHIYFTDYVSSFNIKPFLFTLINCNKIHYFCYIMRIIYWLF